MPASAALGTTVFNMQTQQFSFHAGPVFADIVLVDEINRAPAKTQAALFEVMEERQATIDGERHPMGPLYTILATQNPVEQEGTYKLPEAQLDRFMMKITMGYPTVDQEVEILNRHLNRSFNASLDTVKAVLTQQDLLALRQTLQQVYVDPSRAFALLQGRDFVAPDDIKQVAPSVLAHRIILTAEAEMEELTPQRVVGQLLDKVEVPK